MRLIKDGIHRHLNRLKKQKVSESYAESFTLSENNTWGK
jgi:hypothetical protein